MPEIKFNDKELRLINLASRGLFQTVNSSQFLKSALVMHQIRPEAIDEAINAAILSASKRPKEESEKCWKVIVLLCSLTRKDHQPSQKAVDNAIEQSGKAAAKMNNLEFFTALLNLTAPAREPSQRAIDRTLEQRALVAAKNNNWDFVIALASFANPTQSKSRR